MQLEGWKPTHAGRGATVLYKGPFRLVTDDTGRSYPRGQRIAVDSAEAERLRADADGAAFTIIDAPV
jgi:hypothetical protein